MLGSVYYQIKSKNQPVLPVIQFNHIRRFQKDFSDNIWVSPFIYDEKNQVNISRITTNKANHAILSNRSDIEVLSTFSKVSKYSEWINSETTYEDNIIELFFVTPMAIRYQDKRIYYKNPVSLFDVMWCLKRSLPQEYFDGDFSVLNGKPTKLLQNISPNGGTLSFTDLYDRGQTKISGVVGHITIDATEIFENKETRLIISYFLYLLNHFPIGLRRLCLAYPYRTDIVPVPELSNKEHQYGISINPTYLYAMLYELHL